MLTTASWPYFFLSGDAAFTEIQLHVTAIKIQMEIQEQNLSQIQQV